MNKEGVCKALCLDSLEKLKPLITPENVNTVCFCLETPLEYAARQQAEQCFFWLFGTMKANVGNALFVLVDCNNVYLTEYLLLNGVNPNACIFHDGRSALSFAVCSVDMTALLLSYGANPNAWTDRRDFRTVLDLALHNATHQMTDFDPDNYVDMKNLLRYRTITRLLIEAGATTTGGNPNKRALIADIKRNMATKKYHCRLAMVALFLGLKSHGVPKDVVRFMAKRFVAPTWKDERWIKFI